ncbi:hypothetical protein BpHYR1_001433 [Brachionus plicatilis]|uniref:Uncharacterized protein n=1 Tax=Brachionus plicatilis TaxID=10195 RepID=A0A3M7PUP5_BRAPC|nr:hypothetical protein BpHYR1_001433 [Brachionus plicatilis]
MKAMKVDFDRRMKARDPQIQVDVRVLLKVKQRRKSNNNLYSPQIVTETLILEDQKGSWQRVNSRGKMWCRNHKSKQTFASPTNYYSTFGL